MSSYLLTECTDDGEYNAVQCGREYLSYDILLAPAALDGSDDVGHVHGPAFVPQSSRNLTDMDFVPCVRCLLWPSQAADWPSRHRQYGWPDSATVERVVSNGCDVVYVAHRSCEKDESMNNHQCRLSFSRAEIVLLKSWMPVQQIVYHVLRVFVKTERLTDSANDAGAKAFTNYHIKTLTLWACELKPRSWWIDDVDVVRICVELLHILAVWLNDGRCANYFIINCNLLGYCDDSYYTECIARQLASVTEPWLAEWFISNYVRKCAQQNCPRHVSRLFLSLIHI